MHDDPLLPPAIADDIQRLYAALSEVSGLLTIGRAYGLVVGVSPRLAAQIEMRYGGTVECKGVLANTWRVDPGEPIA